MQATPTIIAVWFIISIKHLPPAFAENIDRILQRKLALLVNRGHRLLADRLGAAVGGDTRRGAWNLAAGKHGEANIPRDLPDLL